ncbi:MAG: hypothetical protein BWK79_04730 [Beggiatoa sp. IS2]|nr:MAG: hypothetical protein BWK79_04730 [Beggiatoa sp. IS2]
MASNLAQKWDSTLKNLATVAIETCHTGIIVLNGEARIVIWNAWMIRHSGIEADTAYGQRIDDLFPELAHSRITQSVKMALFQGMSSLLSQSLHGAPFPLYPPKKYQFGDEIQRLQQMVTVNPLSAPESARHCLIQITDMTHVVKREHLLRTTARQMWNPASEYHISEIYLRAILDNALDAVVTTNAQGFVEVFNPAAEKIFGFNANEMLGNNVNLIIPNEGACHHDIYIQRYLETGQAHIIGLCREVLGKRKDNSLVPLELSVSEMRLNGKYVFIGIMRDITHRKQIEEALVREKERALVTLGSIGDAVVTTDAEGMVQYMNPVAEQLTGWENQITQGVPLTTVFQVYDINGKSICATLYNQCLQEGKTVILVENMRLLNRNSQTFYIEGTLAPIRHYQHIIGTVIAFHDVSQARQMAYQLNYQATHDALTDLVNRTEFERRLNQAISDSRYDKRHHVLCYMDLDQFKVVNDTCGHTAGDELLRQVTALLKTKIRDTDTLARLGGDEFGVLLKGCNLDNGHVIAETLRKVIGDFRFVWEGKTFSIGVSIGLIAITSESLSVSTVLSAADTACYAAKDTGRNRIWVYQHDDAELSQRHGQMQWDSRITQAIEENRFLLHCQPIVPLLITSSIFHLELFLRMLDENGAIVPPMAFIPAAERYNMMVTIDRWVVEKALDSYESVSALQPNLVMNINLSSVSIGDEYFLKFVQEQFLRFNVNPAAVCFEITETAAIAHLNKALFFIKTLKAIGCHFALDDFGSGLSSFAYLKNLPIDYLKIDGAFVKDMLEDPVDCAAVESINKIGHVMGIETVAECVENDEILDKLREMGVNYVQGYGIAEPVPLSDLKKIM